MQAGDGIEKSSDIHNDAYTGAFLGAEKRIFSQCVVDAKRNETFSTVARGPLTCLQYFEETKLFFVQGQTVSIDASRQSSDAVLDWRFASQNRISPPVIGRAFVRGRTQRGLGRHVATPLTEQVKVSSESSDFAEPDSKVVGPVGDSHLVVH